MTAKRLEKFIPYVGIEYGPNARQENLVDCWGLIILIYRKVYNIELPTFETSGLSKDGITNTVRLICNNPLHETFSPVDSIDSVIEGDILILMNHGNPTHIGMVVDNKHMIHAFDKAGSTIESFRSNKWQTRIRAIYRHPHLD